MPTPLDSKITTTSIVTVSGIPVSGVYPNFQSVIAPQTDRIVTLVEMIAVNQQGGILPIQLYDGWTAITPSIPVAASGTFFWQAPDGGRLDLTSGSGFNVALNGTGAMDITAYYILYDDSAPITKSAARTASYTPTVTRTPNRIGDQAEG